jgi:hypothetical protein
MKDPHLLAPAIGSLGVFARRAGRVAFAVIATVLEPDEQVVVVLQGKFLGEDGAAVLTQRRLVLANDREWKPDIESVVIGPGLTVQGWQDDRTASLVFVQGGVTTTIDQISDRELAQRVAALVRSRVPG